MEPVRKSTEQPARSLGRLPLLLGLAVVLAGTLFWDRRGDWSVGPVPPGVAAQEKAETAVENVRKQAEGEGPGANPLARLDLDQLHDTVRRPLFEKTRRPVKAPPPTATLVQAPPAAIVPRRTADPNALTLLGVLIGEGSPAIALLRRNQTGQNVRLQEGDTVDGWTIERIEPESVLLKHGDTQIALQLFRKR